MRAVFVFLAICVLGVHCHQCLSVCDGGLPPQWNYVQGGKGFEYVCETLHGRLFLLLFLCDGCSFCDSQYLFLRVGGCVCQSSFCLSVVAVCCVSLTGGGLCIFV